MVRRNKTDFIGALEAGGDGNRKDQVSEEKTDGEKTGRDDWNRGTFNRGCGNSVAKTSWNL